MANMGPPTPPAEIQDEVKMSEASTSAAEPPAAPVAAVATQPPPPPPPVQLQDPYQLIFPRIIELANQKQWLELIDTAETTEIHAINDQQLSRLLVIVPLILAYLIQNEIPIATLVVKRLPNMKSIPLMKAVGDLTLAYSSGVYEQIHSEVNTLSTIVAQPDFPEPQLAKVVQSMVADFLISFRNRTFLLLARAYTSMSLSLAEMYFNMSADELLPVAANQGWTYDVSSKILKPVATKEPTSFTAPGASSLSEFNFIAQSVSQLEL
ncbi:hypothetical protein BT96DRAFT_883263 [Gymnopus androsaceus JB14]|uniref:CSN8/PSMD8/EIF3K domain-containing protein n=1 Tax=Gymnopus androsaceus JB14 TaxID=1447944 RepID=A0A6A4HMU1_9AGAR|nr:hypothetical protein BT96DRAFT_883263 [Gymnopus androsaceus JB14]